MIISRRSLLKGAAATGTVTALARCSHARERSGALPEAVGMLYDSTRCIGCRACVTKCKEVNGLPFDRDASGIYDTPTDLSSTTKNIIKVFRNGDNHAFVKQQCMHCVDPACVSVCMMGALHKEGSGKRNYPTERKGTGIVLYDKGTCVGCRYCQIACPFNVPKFQWQEAFPVIAKCEMCWHRRDPSQGEPFAIANPACCEVCPREAVIFGMRASLLAEAKRRIVADPKRYNGRIYGEREGGGTQVLYLAPAGVSFKDLGMPDLPAESSAHFSESVSHAPYLYGITPVALYAAMAFVLRRRKKRDDRLQRGGETKR